MTSFVSENLNRAPTTLCSVPAGAIENWRTVDGILQAASTDREAATVLQELRRCTIFETAER
jgi:hypothetical protein